MGQHLKANFETGFSLHRLKGWNQALSSYTGQLNSACTAPTTVALYAHSLVAVQCVTAVMAVQSGTFQ
jgi:hypothetical protein